jgi:hypothetical protein
MSWNSCTASWLTVPRTPLIELSLLSAPSTETLFERARWPPALRPAVGAGPIDGELSRTIVELVSVKLRKFRPLMGRFSIAVRLMVEATDVRVVSMSSAPATIVTLGVAAAEVTSSARSSSADCPTVSVMPEVWSFLKPSAAIESS